MLLRIPEVLPPAVVAKVRAIIEPGDWSPVPGRATGYARQNRQLSEDGKAARAARGVVLECLAQNAQFFTAGLPRKIYPPQFNRYDASMGGQFGNHVDNAVLNWTQTATQVRADLAATLFLSDPLEYEGGELVIETAYDAQAVKLRAGDLLLYSAGDIHRIELVTRGSRLACFFWVESMVREADQRRLLYELDMTIISMREAQGESAELVRLTGVYHNLLRMWSIT